MHARVFWAQARPGLIDEGVGIFHNAIVPANRRQPGYQGGLLLVDRRTGKFLILSLWGAEAEMLTSEHSGHFREQFAKISHILMGAPLREHYTVNVEVGLAGAGQIHTQARVTTGLNLPGTEDELIQIFADNVVPVVQGQPGFVCTLLMTDPESHKSMTVSIWTTAAAMHASEQSGYYHQQLAKIAHLYAGPGVREHYEVLGHV